MNRLDLAGMEEPQEQMENLPEEPETTPEEIEEGTEMSFEDVMNLYKRTEEEVSELRTVIEFLLKQYYESVEFDDYLKNPETRTEQSEIRFIAAKTLSTKITELEDTLKDLRKGKVHF